MKNVNRIIAYLSGDMSAKDARRFREELESDLLLREEFEQVSETWEVIKKQLSLSSADPGLSKEEMIASIMAEFDLERFGTSAVSKDEVRFKRKLRSIMDNEQAGVRQATDPVQNDTSGKRLSVRLLTIITLSAAAVLTFLIVILFPRKDLDYLVTSYYRPADDLIPEHIDPLTRSGMDNALLLFGQENYNDARMIIESHLQKTEEDTLMLTLYAISLFETGSQERGLELLNRISSELNTPAELDAAWYRVLLLFRSGGGKKAMPLLDSLISSNSYHSPAAQRLKSVYEQELKAGGNNR